MDIFSKRPLFLSCMLFIACSVAAFFMPENVKLFIIAAFVLALIFTIILVIFKSYSSNRKLAVATCILCLISVIFSMLSSFLFYDVEQNKRTAEYGKENLVDAVVTSCRYENSYSSSYTITVKNINGKSDKHKAILECEYPAALEIGEKISGRFTATEPEVGGKYDEALEALSNGIFVIYTSDDGSQLVLTDAADEDSAELLFSKLNYELSSILRRNVEGDAGDISTALFLGNKSFLSPTITRDFRRVGASHFLALSGLHMSLVMGVALLILKRTVKYSTPISVILSFIALFYLALTGFSISAMRSVIMLLIVYLSNILSGMPDSLTSLSIAGFIIILVSPGAIADAAFWMSFSATFGILVFMSPINDYFQDRLDAYDGKFQFYYHKVIFSCITAVTTTIAALIPLIIVMCIFIKEMSVFSILSSIVLSIPTALVILASMFLLPLHGVPYISNALVFIIRSAADFMVKYCSDLSEYENIVISLNYPFAIGMAILLGITLFMSLISKNINPFISLAPFAVALLILCGTVYVYESTNDENLKVSYINAASNSDMLVISNEREAVICDISNGSETSYGLAIDEVFESRATEIKAIMITRYTDKHNATMYELFQQYKIREVWVPYPENMDQYYRLETLYRFAGSNNVDVYVYEDGDSLALFEHSYIMHNNTYIERSAVPVDLINIYTSTEHMTYVSSAYNESDIYDAAEYSFSKSQHVIFGNRGPKTKTLFEINSMDKLKTVTFADKTRVAYFVEPEYSFTAYYLIPKAGEMEYYLKE